MNPGQKYDYLYVVQGKYEDAYGWEDLTASDNRSEAADDLRAYNSNEPYPHRMVQRRVLREESGE